MVPYKQYTLPLLAAMAEDYLTVAGTYEGLASGATAEDDFDDHTHLLFKLIERCCELVNWIEEFVQKLRFRLKESLWQSEPAPMRKCPNAWKARKEGKESKLNRLRSAMELMNTMDVGSFIERLQMAGAREKAEPFSLLTGAKTLRLLTPHNWELKLW